MTEVVRATGRFLFLLWVPEMRTRKGDLASWLPRPNPPRVRSEEEAQGLSQQEFLTLYSWAWGPGGHRGHGFFDRGTPVGGHWDPGLLGSRRALVKDAALP